MSAQPEDLAEARALLASARALLGELVEEGLTTYEPAALPPLAEPIAPATPALELPTRPVASPTTPTPSGSPPATESIQQPPEAPAWGPEPTLEAVREALGDCRRCQLCAGRQKIVFGDGNPDADLLFVGEAPGENEDRQGLPFVGRAGELLTQMIEKGIGLARSDVYICNIVKCRPPGNRNPLPPEVSACRSFLDGQIDAVRPKVIVTLGRPAASLLLGRDVAITRTRGIWQEYRGIPLMPTLHPAYVLRQYTAETRRNVWEDLKAALARVHEG
ncbi:MAG: uracil-DNA glycosylase [Deltaproteobacteria bacterium]|jgi:DNA polymerase|nr:uracil-DNA glycosylase [Deltaproteobacteria bacterium]